MTDINDQNLIAAARNATNTKRLLNHPNEYAVGIPAQPLRYWQELSIELSALNAAVEQRIQELGSHEPQEFG